MDQSKCPGCVEPYNLKQALSFANVMYIMAASWLKLSIPEIASNSQFHVMLFASLYCEYCDRFLPVDSLMDAVLFFSWQFSL